MSNILPMNKSASLTHRLLDLLIALTLSVLVLPLVTLAVLISTLVHKSPGLFVQTRLGHKAIPFRIYKIRTMYPSPSSDSVTIDGYSSISSFGRLLRHLKIDELPQLLNVIRGDLSLVGFRPDTPGWHNSNINPAPDLLKYKPGLTSLVSLAYSQESTLLSTLNQPHEFYKHILFPLKSRQFLSESRSLGFAAYFFALLCTLSFFSCMIRFFFPESCYVNILSHPDLLTPV